MKFQLGEASCWISVRANDRNPLQKMLDRI